MTLDLDDLRLLAETARLRLLATPWGLGRAPDAQGREFLLEAVRSGAILRPLASTEALTVPEEELPEAVVALSLAAFYAAGLLAARGERVPDIMVPLVTNVLEQLRRVSAREAAP